MISFPICADFFPHGEVARKFGILREGTPVPGIPERAAFVVDKRGQIAFAKIYPLDDLPKIDDLLEQLRKMSG
jgi:peroxiredoxin